MSTTKTSARTELTAKPEVPPSGRSKNKDDWGAAVRLLTREAFGVVSDPDPRLIADCVLNSLPRVPLIFLCVGRWRRSRRTSCTNFVVHMLLSVWRVRRGWLALG
jgi:hypothetical protein